MARRDNRIRDRRRRVYIVACPLGDLELSAGEWHRLVRAGLLRVVERRIARPARNVIAWLDAGKVRLLHVFWIYTSWYAIERWAPARGEHYERDLARQYATKDFWAAVAARGRFADGDFVQ